MATLTPLAIQALGMAFGAAVRTTAITAVAVSQQNKQIAYQQEVTKQNMIAAQNKTAADMKMREKEANRKHALARAQMSATGIDSTSGSFLDLIGQGAAAGELDVLKAKYDGDSQAWALNAKINELETNKKNAWLEAGISGVEAGANNLVSSNVRLPGNNNISAIKKEKTGKLIAGGYGGFGAAMEGTVT